MDKENNLRELSFEEILLDERLVQGDIWILKNVLQSVGGINYRLGAKRNYELLIRIAKEYTVLRFEKGIVCGISKEALEKGLFQGEDGRKDKWVYLKQEPEFTAAGDDMSTEQELKTDCYLIGRYRTELNSMGYFDDVVQGILSVGRKTITQYLARMIARTKEFYDIYDATQPILIYVGFDRCYNIYDIFSRCLGQALEELGQCVEYFDMSKQQIEDLDLFMLGRYKAVISMHYSMLYLQSGNGYIHDAIAAPKYHFTFDHPIWEKPLLEQKPNGVCVLTLDGNYVKFVKDHYEHQARFLPPAGREETFSIQEKDYEVVFLGTCYGGGLMEDIGTLMETDRETRYLINRYILYMRKDLRGTPEHAFQKALDYYGIAYTEKEFMEMFYSAKGVIQWLACYYRKKVIKTLLEAGITVHVFGDKWKDSSMYADPALICHEEAVGKKALEVYARAKLSLNIMMWHKDGFTERIADSMLQKSVVVTDRTTYLEKNFVNGEDLLMFDLGNLRELPNRIRELLGDEEKRKRVAENGYRKAVGQHTWKHRAEKILEFIEEDRGVREP